LRGQILSVPAEIDDICPCDWSWKNHGEYVRCVSETASRFVEAGFITQAEQRAAIKDAAHSDCGKAR
jgi:hypothetical protein